MNVKYSLFRPRGLLWFYWTDHIPASPCLKYLLWLFCPATLVWNYYFNYYLFFDLFAQRDFDVLCVFAVPLLSRVCPSDVCRIWKSGASLRVDATLLGFENMTWIRGQRSYIFRGDGVCFCPHTTKWFSCCASWRKSYPWDFFCCFE